MQPVDNALRLAHVAQRNNMKATLGPITILTGSPEDVVIEESQFSLDFEHHPRKRARGSLDRNTPVEVESTMQLNTRSLLRGQAQNVEFPSMLKYSLSDASRTGSFNARMKYEEISIPPHKKLCLEVEPMETWRPTGGPGMWNGIL